MNKLLYIVGPTATGKTELAIKIARACGGEIISADSRQVYKGMDIGTGKDVFGKKKDHTFEATYMVNAEGYCIAPYIVDGIHVWLYDVVTPDHAFSVSHWHNLASQLIKDVRKRNNVPIVVGGTGLYISSLLHTIETINIKPNSQLREKFANASIDDLCKALKEKGFDVEKQMNESDRKNPRRLLRKLEILSHISEEKNKDKDEKKYDTLLIGIHSSERLLRKRIFSRVDHRVELGVIQEVKNLLKTGYDFSLPSVHTMGYKEWKRYVKEPSEQAKKEAIEAWKMHELQYAKRQMTWFKKQKNIHWYVLDDPQHEENIMKKVALWYTTP